MKRTAFPLLILLILASLVLSACGGAAPEAEDEEALSATYVSTGPIGVNPFLELIAEGLQEAGQDCDVETKVVESNSLTEMEDNMRAEIEAGTDLIVANSFDSVDAVTRLGEEFPEQKWAIVDTGVEGNPNVRGLVFREHEGMFLIGAIAGSMTETDTVGFVGAMDIPLIRRWYVGYEQGVQHVNPDATILEAWGNSFNDPATSKELALAQEDQGADFIPAVSAAGNTGIFEAAQEEGFLTTGVDTDQRGLDPQHIVEAMVKRTDVGVYEAVCDLAAGEFSGGFVSYGLAENGVGPAFLILEEDEQAIEESRVPEEVRARVRDLAEQVRQGEIEVTDYLEQAE